MTDITPNDIVKALRIIRRVDLPPAVPIELIDDAIQDWMRKFPNSDKVVVGVQDAINALRARRSSQKTMPGDYVRALIGRQPSLKDLQRLERE